MRITLNGLVVASGDQWLYDWFGVEAFSPAVVRQALADNPEGEALEVELNSPGGSVFAGFELYSLLREGPRAISCAGGPGAGRWPSSSPWPGARPPR